MPFNAKQLEKYPTQPGVYLMKDREGSVLYVGKAKVLKNRIKQYFAQTGGDTRAMIPFLTEQVTTIDTIVVPSEKEALLLENTLIKRHKPRFNALLKDDKTFISLMINNTHPWPMIRLVRLTEGKSRRTDGIYFGPYTSAYSARATYDLLTELFPLRQCSDEELKRRTRPCLLYGIKRCIAPCVGKCTKEEYDTYVQGAIQFLKGQNKEILKNLQKTMQRASDAMDYEKAAALLHIIRQVEHVLGSQGLVAKPAGKDCDALALYREGEEVMLVQLFFRGGKLIGSEQYAFSHILEDDDALFTSFILQHYQHKEGLPEEIILPISLKEAGVLSEILSESHKRKVAIVQPKKGSKQRYIDIAIQNAMANYQKGKNAQVIQEKMLLDLQDTLKLNRYPTRIICLDTSHIAGSDPVASLIAFTNAEKDPKRTRLFKIKTAAKSDDYGALREVLRRYLTKAKENDDLPDLLIVDGGKGQLGVAIAVFKELDIASVDVIALSKEEGRHDKGMTREKIYLREDHDPILLNPRSSLLFLLQKMRDEAHRKAITFHQKRRSKRTITSALDAISGIGPIKRARLLKTFGSVEALRNATEEEWKQVKGVTKKDVQTLKSYFTRE